MLILASLLTLIACGAPCEVDGVTYADGESWTCADGCNTCACENGAVASTLMACEAATCTEGGVTYAAGQSWTCADGCNDCTCLDDGTIEQTDMDCG
jgi:hypothetical protein